VTPPLSFTDDYTWMRDGEKEYLKEYYDLTERAAEEIQRDFVVPEEFPGKDVVITALGTGSSIPSKYRNGNIVSQKNTTVRYPRRPLS